MNMKLIAAREFGSLKKGDKFTRGKGYGRVLVAIGFAKADDEPETPWAPAPPDVEAPRVKRTYKRRDLTAEPPRKKRAYKRRDLNADRMSDE